MGIDYLFYPEMDVAGEVINLLGHTSSTEYVDFSGGHLALVVFRLEPNSDLVGRELKGFSDEESLLNYRTVAITREGKTIIPRKHESFQEGDMVYVITRRETIDEVMSFSGKQNVEVKNMMVLGGSRIGIRVASLMQEYANVKLIDYNKEKAYRLIEQPR